MRIARSLLDQIVEHARRDAPNECCGVIAAREGVATTVHELENLAHSPLKFEVGADLVGAMEAIEDGGAELAAIYHSHTRTPPVPSQTDVNFSINWPGVEWLIVGLSHDGEALVRSWRIDGGVAEEATLEVVD